MDQEGHLLLDSFFYENLQNSLVLRQQGCLDISFLNIGASESANHRIEDSTYGINDLFGSMVNYNDSQINAEKEHTKEQHQARNNHAYQSFLQVKLQPGLDIPQHEVVSYPQKKQYLTQMKSLSKALWREIGKRKRVSISGLVAKITEKDRYSTANSNMENYQRKAYNNLKRRIYDSINVFSALGLIQKNRKELLLIRGQNMSHNKSICQHSQQDNQYTHKILKKLKIQYSIRSERLTKLKQKRKEALDRCELIRNLIARNIVQAQKYNSKLDQRQLGTQALFTPNRQNIIKFPFVGMYITKPITVQQYTQKVKVSSDHPNISLFGESKTLFFIPSIKSQVMRKKLKIDLSQN